jgi:hypothetical protein
MRLTSAQVERALDQFEAQAIPEDHPVAAQLNDLFGDHTFFLDTKGLNVVEPVDPVIDGETAKVVNLADWADDSLTRLAPHPPHVTEIVIALGPTH